MVCSLRLYILMSQINLRHNQRIFSISCAFFSFVNRLFINDFCCLVANIIHLSYPLQHIFGFDFSVTCSCSVSDFTVFQIKILLFFNISKIIGKFARGKKIIIKHSVMWFQVSFVYQSTHWFAFRVHWTT